MLKKSNKISQKKHDVALKPSLYSLQSLPDEQQ